MVRANGSGSHSDRSSRSRACRSTQPSTALTETGHSMLASQHSTSHGGPAACDRTAAHPSARDPGATASDVRLGNRYPEFGPSWRA